MFAAYALVLGPILVRRHLGGARAWLVDGVAAPGLAAALPGLAYLWLGPLPDADMPPLLAIFGAAIVTGALTLCGLLASTSSREIIYTATHRLGARRLSAKG